MRILIVTSHRNMVGGVEKYLQGIIPCLAQRGHELALLYKHRFDPKKEPIDPPDLQIPCLGIEEAGAAQGLRFAADWKPDIAYLQGMEAADFRSALLHRYPTVFYAHNYVGTCASGEKCHAFPSPQPCDRQFGPACMVLYYPRRCGGLNPLTTWKLFERSRESHAQLRKYSAVLVASAHMRREYERHGVLPERIHLAPLPNPHQTADIQSRSTSRAGNKLLFIGRLTKLKGARQLLEAIPLAEKQLGRRLTASIAGDGPERTQLQDFASRSGLQVEFTGWVDTERKVELIQQADLLVVPSLWPEPFGLVGIEAGAHGLPAVAYDVGGISDWLISGYSGELAPGHPPSAEGLAAAMTRALSDSSHYQDLCRGAQEVAARFTLGEHLAKLESTLESALDAVRRANAQGPRGEEPIHADA